MKSVSIRIAGIVQGVGFRPFVFKLAEKTGVRGYVLNDSSGVLIVVEGGESVVDEFVRRLKTDAPPAASIENIAVNDIEYKGYPDFSIRKSERETVKTARVSPDIATCSDCLREINDKNDRRFGYAFTNCTNCGPRFTIIKDVPYDRPNTTMAAFKMCPDCMCEYENPRDRRFHAQPNACPVCGPSLSLFDRAEKKVQAENLIEKSAELLRAGFILAIKGLGGYHLACDAESETAASALRSRKYREDKPFAVMVKDLDAAKKIADISKAEKTILESVERPIVILKKRSGSKLAASVAPRNKNVGVMFPYTPIHHMLLAEFGGPLVMTSGNLSDEPISYKDSEAAGRLGNIYDYILTHNREIETRCDDSVVREISGGIYFVRRSRGYAPRVIRIGRKLPRPVLAAGGMLKSTFAVAKSDAVYVSHHIGDLENAETLAAYEAGIGHFKKMFDVEPEVVVHDLHPDYLSTRYAQAMSNVKKIPLQHHKAHIFSLKADAEILDRPLIGVAMDGTGYGEDGAIWGGEFFISDGGEMNRAAHLEYLPLPSGEGAIKEPWRMGVSALVSAFGEFPDFGCEIMKDIPKEKIAAMLEMIKKEINCPMTSSAGRLFDAASALSGVVLTANYEGQAAVEFEQAGDFEEKKSYRFELRENSGEFLINSAPVFRELAEDLRSGLPVKNISGKFHNAFAEMIRDVVIALSEKTGIREAGLSGGVFQNAALLGKTFKVLESAGVKVYIHRKVPPNDGGISLGQAAYATWSE